MQIYNFIFLIDAAFFKLNREEENGKENILVSTHYAFTQKKEIEKKSSSKSQTIPLQNNDDVHHARDSIYKKLS